MSTKLYLSTLVFLAEKKCQPKAVNENPWAFARIQFGGSPMFFDFKNGRQKIWNPIICQNEAVRPWGPWRCWGAAPDFQVSSGKWRFENTKSQKKNTLSFNSPKKSEGSIIQHISPPWLQIIVLQNKILFKKMTIHQPGLALGLHVAVEDQAILEETTYKKLGTVQASRWGLAFFRKAGVPYFPWKSWLLNKGSLQCFTIIPI